MKATLGSMVWIPKRNLTDAHMAKLRGALTVYPKAKFGEVPSPVKGYIENPEWMGVPRNLHTLFDCDDQTHCRGGMKWPAFKGTYRAGQEPAITTIVDFFRDGGYNARLEAKCGAGKTLAALSVAAKMGLRLLVIIHKEDLADNWRNDAGKFFPGVTVGHVQGDSWAYKDAHVTTCMAQTLWARKGHYPADFLKSFDMVVVDEGHRFAATMFEYCLRIFPARYRLGVSATWRRSDGLEPFFEFHLGKVVAKMSSQRLVGNYIMVPCRLAISMHPKMPWARKLNLLAESKPYTSWLATEIGRAANAGRKVLVVSDRIAQLVALQQALTSQFGASGKACGLFIGAVSKEEQEATKSADVVLATYQMICEGTDIPALDTLFVASPRADMEQTVGRIQRKCDGKKSLLIVDPYMATDLMMSRVAGKRRAWYDHLGFTPQR
jgi:superfamily II DNA or RNA helicase